MLIIVLDVISQVNNITQILSHNMGQTSRALITAVILLFWIITFMLIFGFQRTVYTEDQKQQSPLVLLREGKHFILPLAVLSIIYNGARGYLHFPVFWAIKHVPFVDTGFADTCWGARLIFLLYSTSFDLILIKPILLIFPLIIVLDCNIFKSFKMLGKCRLRNAKELVILYLASLVLMSLWTFLLHQSSTTISYYLLTVLQIIIYRFIALMIAVMAIRFVASQNLIYDNGSKPLDSQDSLTPSI